MLGLKTSLKAAQPALERAVLTIDRAFSRYAQPRRARGKLLLQPYLGWGTPHHVEIVGRVLLPRLIAPAQVGDPRWRNAVSILRRLFSREVGGIEVRGVLGGKATTAVSDGDGYFSLLFQLDEALGAGWHEAALTLGGREGRAAARVQVVERPRYAVISDLDDTVIRSDVTSVGRMLVTALTGNARTRSPFPGVRALYRALCREDEERNPIFYVSSSPWNFYDLLLNFLSYRQIPLGPLFLRNWGMELLGGHGSHKHEVIERLFERFPDLPFVLVGDSGEKDPEIYAEVVRKYPGRVLAVYIRDVTGGERDTGVLKLRDEVRRAGVDLVLARDSLNAAGHAMSLGLITPSEYALVVESIANPS